MTVYMKYMFAKGNYVPSVQDNQDKLQDFLDTKHLDALVVTSQDFYISEYVPLENNPRYALSGFSGSMGNGLLLSRQAQKKLGLESGPFVLFVDGRYHLQADLQTDPSLVTVVKLSLDKGLFEGLGDWIGQRDATLSRVGFAPERLSVQQWEGLKKLSSKTNFTPVDSEGVDNAVVLPGWQVNRPIYPMAQEATGHTIQSQYDRLKAYFGSKLFLWVSCQSDDLSYLLSSRGHHLPNISSHLGYLFVTQKTLVLFLPKGCETCPVQLDHPQLIVVRNNITQLQEVLGSQNIESIFYQGASINTWVYGFLKEHWPQILEHQSACDVVVKNRVQKNEAELRSIKEAFLRSSRAIARTIRFAKWEDKTPLSEWDLSEKISQEYQKEGAENLSFTSIAGCGPTSAIIHYTDASPSRPLTPGELVLLDSGAYYKEGFATDCTRVVLRNPSRQTKAQDWQKRIYTVTLKSSLKGLMAQVPAHTTGIAIDALCRQVCQDYGYNYAHGTGHGVGIHVHESGIRFSTVSPWGLTPQAVVSIEPGIYLEGQGGVRIENIVVVRQASAKQETFCFENLVFVGYDWDLIDISLLTEEEKIYLSKYEQSCRELGTELMECPLL